MIGNPNPAWVGETVTFTFTVSPVPDGGYVTFGDQQQFPVDVTTGQATYATSYASAATYELPFWYVGTDAFAGSPPILVTTVVRQHVVTATLSVPSSPVGRGDAFDVTVNLDGAPPDGTVLIQDMTNGNPGPAIAGALVDGSTPMTIRVPGLEPGSYLIRANFTGTPAYAADVTEAQGVTIFDRPTTTSASLETNPTRWGEATNLNVVVGPVPDDGGFVKVIRNGSDQGFATMDWTTGTGTFALAPADPGVHQIVAQYLPGSWPHRYAPSSTSIEQTVTEAPIDTDPPVATIVINGDDPLATDGYVILTIEATDASEPLSIRLSCDGGLHWQPGSVGVQGWSVSQNECPGEGPKTVTAEVKDFYGNTTVVSDTIVLETDGPIGTIILADGSMVSIWPTVSISISASDAGSGVSQVALSNDGLAWTTRTYSPEQTWQLEPGDGPKTVYTKWRDGYGHWSAVKSDSIVLDTTAPKMTAPVARFSVGSALASGAPAIQISWTAGDATSGVSHVLVRQQTDGGTWTAPLTAIGNGITRRLATGHSYRFAVRAIDKAGNVGDWTYGPTFRLTAISQSSSAVRYAGTWATSTSTIWWGGTARSSSRAGSTASYTFTGKSIAWVGLKGIGRGKANVYVNGVYKATVDLYSATTKKQLVVWSANYATSATRTVTIKVLGTAGRPRVDVDGFIVGS